jgi:hypothetical protein
MPVHRGAGRADIFMVGDDRERPIRFELERRAVVSALADHPSARDHGGSTSVSGLADRSIFAFCLTVAGWLHATHGPGSPDNPITRVIASATGTRAEPRADDRIGSHQGGHGIGQLGGSATGYPPPSLG